MVRLVFLSACVIFTFAGCRKKNLYEVQGTAREFYDQLGIQGVEVEVAYAQIGFGSVSGGYDPITTAMSEADGTYALEFEYVATSTFRIRARKDGFLLAEEIVNADDWSTDEVNALDFSMYKSAGFEIHLFNTGTTDAQMLLRFDKHSEGCLSCCNDQQGWLFEGRFDTTFTCPVYGNQHIDYSITRIWPGNAEISDHTIYVDQGEYLIEHEF